MTYYVYRRGKTPTTYTYGVITQDDPSRLPTDIFVNGKWYPGGPWTFVQSIDFLTIHPAWFKEDQAQHNIKAHGFWLVDFEK